MPIDQQLAMADAYEERRQATAALEQAANSLPADVDARSLSRYAQQLENARYAQELETSARQGAGEAPILHNAASVAANAWNLPAALDYAKQWAQKYIYRRLRAHRREYARANDEYLPGRGAGRNGPQH